MNLREKTLLILGATFICAFVLIFALSFTFYTSTLLNLEQQDARKGVLGSLHAIDNELNRMEGSAVDWGWWDDTYRFSQDLNPQYITDNLGESTFRNLRINYFVITSPNGTVIFAKGYDLKKNQEIPVPQDFLAMQSPVLPPNEFPAKDRGVSGIISYPGGQILVASAPILTSVQQGPSTGFLVLGRAMDEDVLMTLSNVSGESLYSAPIVSSITTNPVTFAPRPLRALSIDINQSDPDFLTATANISDTYGSPAFIIGATSPRDFYQIALGVIKNYFIIFTILMAISAGLVVLIIDKLVLARLTVLISRVREGNTLLEGDHLPPMPGNDEFVQLDEVVQESRQRIRESEAQFRRIIETSQEGIFVMDKEFRLTYGNERFFHMLGYSSGEILGLPITTFVRPDDAVYLENKLRNRQKGNSEVYENNLIRKDGSKMSVIVSANPIFAGTVFSGSFIMITDITDRKRAETALQLANRKLNMLNRIALDDLQNQIFTLQAYIELSGLAASDENENGYFLKQRASATNLQNQIAFIRLFQDMGIHPPKWQNVNNVFLYAISHLDLSHIIRIATLGTLEIYADPLFEKVLLTLAENSIQHGRTVTEIRVSCSTPDDEGITLIYEDNGTGIPSAEKEEIFRHHYAKKGVPLWLAREILSITDITLRETGIPGQGVRFEMHVKKGFFRFGSSNPTDNL